MRKGERDRIGADHSASRAGRVATDIVLRFLRAKAVLRHRKSRDRDAFPSMTVEGGAHGVLDACRGRSFPSCGEYACPDGVIHRDAFTQQESKVHGKHQDRREHGRKQAELDRDATTAIWTERAQGP